MEGQDGFFHGRGKVIYARRTPTAPMALHKKSSEPSKKTSLAQAVLYGFLSILGRLLAAAPEAVPSAIARCIGWLIYSRPGSRRRALLANLHHAFPEKTERWRRRIALESCRRMVEMGLFVLASPYFSTRRIQRMFTADADLAAALARQGEAGVMLVPHFSLMEALTQVRVICPELRAEMEMGAFYRPFGNAGLERWVKATRERFGVRLLSRRDGFGEASAILRRQGRVAVLFDQHAGRPGALSLFMGRLVSTSELAGLLAEKHHAQVFAYYTQRTGFWRGVLKGELLMETPVASAVTAAGNVWLENKLRSDEGFCADWLWMHKRWKIGADATRRFAITQRRNILPENLDAFGLAVCPRKERFWIRLPDAPDDAAAAVPLVQAIRAARFDAEVTLIARASCKPVLERLDVAEKILVPPERGVRRWVFFRRLRREFPDTYVVLPDSRGADFEAWLTGAPQRFGVKQVHRCRPLLTHGWTVPRGVDATRAQQARLWELWLQKAHGLPVPSASVPLESVPSAE
ncbi:MAG: hypothetical protein LBV28_02150 [Puniceicoccales bacterium]|nr:hypothetical protein [Puniceicoccales bacterium]